MKKLFFVIVFFFAVAVSYCQVPDYAENNSKGVFDIYCEYGVSPKAETQGLYTYWRYGCTDWLDVGFDFSSESGYSEMSIHPKFAYAFSDWFVAGCMVKPNFCCSDNFNYTGTSIRLLFQGNITRNKKFYWITNTGFGLDKELSGSIYQQWVLGYNFSFKNGDTLGPLWGILHSWKMDEDVQPFLGLNYTHKRFNTYLMGSDLVSDGRRFTLAVEVIF